MKKTLYDLIAFIFVASAVSAHAADSINLGNYSVSGIYALDRLFGTSGQGVSGLEASAITYARDRGTLFFVGDEGTGVVEISRTGQTISTMRFIGGANLGWPTASTNRDSEGLTYLGNGVLVVTEERLQNAYRFTYSGNANFNQANVASGVNLANAEFVSIGATIGNVGIEGISYDPRNGNFVTVKQDNPAELRIFSSLPFSTAAAPDVAPGTLFTGATSLFGLNSLSDVQTLAPVDALANTAAADNLLLLSLDSHALLEIDRLGNILSSFDLSGVLPRNAIEGVTIDENGTIYLVAEQDQLPGAPANPQSQLIVLSRVPEPETYLLLLAGLGVLGLFARRRSNS